MPDRFWFRLKKYFELPGISLNGRSAGPGGADIFFSGGYGIFLELPHGRPEAKFQVPSSSDFEAGGPIFELRREN